MAEYFYARYAHSTKTSTDNLLRRVGAECYQQMYETGDGPLSRGVAVCLL